MFTDMTFGELQEKHGEDECLVLLGCGGDPKEWIEGVTGTLKDEDIAPNGIDDFGYFYRLESTGGRTDLVLMFGDNTDLKIGKMAMWRLQFGDNSWLSDFFINYESHY